MINLVVAWALLVLGLLFVVVGLAGAVKTIFNPPVATRGSVSIDSIITAITELIKALTAAPQWLALAVVGIGMMAGAVYVSSLH